jgi:mRNA interferase MazF
MTRALYRQLEIRWVDLDPARGAETKKERPCVILQSDPVNRGSKTVVVAPMLTGHRNWPFVVNIIPTKDNGMDKNRHINLKQLRTVDISRISNRQGILERHYFSAIKETIKLVFDLSQDC